jgi:hypothetical protein
MFEEENLECLSEKGMETRNTGEPGSRKVSLEEEAI